MFGKGGCVPRNQFRFAKRFTPPPPTLEAPLAAHSSAIGQQEESKAAQYCAGEAALEAIFVSVAAQ
jgi:hypothetical protein